MSMNHDLHDLDDASRVLFELVDAQSVSGEERAAAEVFVRHADQLGLDASIDEVGNAIADRPSTGSDTLAHIVLLGHIDTVPGEIAVRIEDGVLFGRGSVDAKGPLSAMLIAASRAQIPEGVRLTVAGAVGEEAAGSIGARHLREQWRPDACIIGEPSGVDGVTLGYKGRLLVRAVFECENTHSAGRDPTACDEALNWWASVRTIAETFNEGTTREFDRIQATIHGMESTSDGLVQRATLHAGFRLPPTMGPESLIKQLESIAGVRVTLAFDGGEHAHATTRNDPVVRAISTGIRAQELRPRPKLKTGTADLNVVAPIWKCPIAAYGPGDSALDHTPNEHIHLSEYRSSIEVLLTALESLSRELVDSDQLSVV